MEPALALDKTGSATGLRDNVGFLATRLHAHAAPGLNRRLAPHGLRARSYAVLALAVETNVASQRHIAAFLAANPSQVVEIVDELERAGLVRREPDPEDRRSRRVIAMPAGIAKLEAAKQAVDQAQEALLAGLDESERATLRGLLQRIAFTAES